METNLGGDRLGSGNKQKIHLRNYERSSHDLGYVWRSSMAAGTLVPFMKELALPGDSFDIKLDADVLTLPTIGPLFGSYKVQLDVFVVPIRLYNAALMQNTLNIGMNMQNVMLPLVKLEANTPQVGDDLDNAQINPSCIFSYLDIRGIASNSTGSPDRALVIREFNAVPWLAYWEIYKNYYANKQEEFGAVIHNTLELINVVSELTILNELQPGGETSLDEDVNNETGPHPVVNGGAPISLRVDTFSPNDSFNPNALKIWVNVWVVGAGGQEGPWALYRVTELFENYYYEEENERFVFTGWKLQSELNQKFFTIGNWYYDIIDHELAGIGIKQFPLENIDKMREKIMLSGIGGASVLIERSDEELMEPYNLPLKRVEKEGINQFRWSKRSNQEGLALKTYQSDLFNNWMQTEWIDGSNGINEITAIDTSGGSFNLDTLNLSKKVYDMLNRIAISGGSYDDWLAATYTAERAKGIQNPVYAGGLSKELIFQEVVSTTQTIEQPLGTLAGKGRMGGKNKGGDIKIKTDEPSYIMGIVSLTPRIDYSQGNKWDTNLRTLDDLHKPALDGIGFQDLITDQMAWWDTQRNAFTEELTFKSAGKQPAWINYMTNVNVVRGNFAISTQEMFMTLNRRYEAGWTNENIVYIKDLTTYIDPSKFNNIFADTRLDAQNFWTQIKVDIFARRKMSAKIIPNL